MFLKYKILFLFGLISFALSSLVNAQQHPIKLKVMSYNIHHANPPSEKSIINLDTIAGIIIKNKASIIALQEVDVATGRSAKVNQAQYLAEKLRMNYHFAKAIDYDGGEYGVAILTNLPIIAAQTIPLPQILKGENRVLAVIKVKIGDDEVIIANTHLDSKDSEENRLVQLQAVVDYFKNEIKPILLCGDMNAEPGSATINKLDSMFQRSCTENCPATYPQRNPRKTIDYIATRNFPWKLIDYQVLEETYASDHRPILSVFDFNITNSK